MKKILLIGGVVLAIILAVGFIFGCNTIPPQQPSQQPASLPIGDGTVWYYRSFGQSTDMAFNEMTSTRAQNGINYVWLDPPWIAEALNPATRATFVTTPAQRLMALEADTPVTLGDFGRVIIESRGGKWANTHMGVSFFFTVLPTDRNFKMTADVTRVFFGGNPDGATDPTQPSWGGLTINGQAGAAMVAMDILNPQRAAVYVPGFDELPAVSNMIGVGFRGNNNHTRALIYDGNTSYGVALGMPNQVQGNIGAENSLPLGETQTWTLERKNDGFYVTVVDSAGTVLVNDARIGDATHGADLVQRVEQDRMYWGFAVARQGRIMVENIKMEDMGPANVIPTTPRIVFPGGGSSDVLLRSASESVVQNYTLSFRGGWNGNVEIRRGAQVLFNGDVRLAVEHEIPLILNPGANEISWRIAVNDSRAAVNGQTFEGTWTINYNAAAPRTVYAAPATVGLGNGTSAANAMALTAAIAAAQAGQTIYLIDGNYANIDLTIPNTVRGAPGNLIRIEPAPGVGRIRVRGINIPIGANFIHLRNFISGGTGPTDRGLQVRVNGDYNIIEDVISEWSNGSGFNSGGATGLDPNIWPTGNLYLNCVSRYSWDTANGADGFALKNAGPGNMFIGCVAHHNIDDGWDFFNRVEDGASFQIIIENCIAFSNGANGFKLGGETQPSNHIVRDSLAFDNNMAGFSCNFNPGPLLLENCVSIDNRDQNIVLRYNPNVPPQTNVVLNSVSFRSDALRTVRGLFDYVAGTVTNSFTTNASGVSSRGTRVLTNADFTTPTVDFTRLGGTRPGVPDTLAEIVVDAAELAKVFTRDADGTLVRGPYGRLITP
jgi:hypothetical protein